MFDSDLLHINPRPERHTDTVHTLKISGKFPLGLISCELSEWVFSQMQWTLLMKAHVT